MILPLRIRKTTFWQLNLNKSKAATAHLRHKLSNMREEDCYVIKYHTACNDEGLKQQLNRKYGKEPVDQMTSESGRVLKAGNQRGRQQDRNRSKSPGGRKQGPCFGCGIDNHIKRDCHHKKH